MILLENYGKRKNAIEVIHRDCLPCYAVSFAKDNHRDLKIDGWWHFSRIDRKYSQNQWLRENPAMVSSKLSVAEAIDSRVDIE